MTAAEDAYREAERLIAAAKRDRATELSLAQPETRAHTALPPSIADLDSVTILDLRSTQVTDLSPLAG